MVVTSLVEALVATMTLRPISIMWDVASELRGLFEIRTRVYPDIDVASCDVLEGGISDPAVFLPDRDRWKSTSGHQKRSSQSDYSDSRSM